ncbi:MAG TPA: CbiX/SirB N-terminal domain-containing protein [Gemmatimonadales bacterium]|nr:CbiX/SirB N-terminal domain-containing protein [Gemmatimonadales bacterium]
MYWNARNIALFLALGAFPTGLGAQTGLLVVSHGANAEWNGQVRQTMAQVQWDGPVGAAFLMGPEAEGAGWNQAVAALVARGAKSIVVVPLMVSSHGSHYRQVQFYAGVIDSLPAELAGHDHGKHENPPVPMAVTAALDAAPEMLEALMQRWGGLDAARKDAPLVLLGHGPQGPDDAAKWVAAFQSALDQLKSAGHHAEGRSALLRDDAAPDVRAASIREMRDTVSALAARAGDSVTVMTVLISQGGMQRVTIPKDLEGLPVRYAPVSLTPLAAIARWIERVGIEAQEKISTVR